MESAMKYKEVVSKEGFDGKRLVVWKLEDLYYSFDELEGLMQSFLDKGHTNCHLELGDDYWQGQSDYYLEFNGYRLPTEEEKLQDHEEAMEKIKLQEKKAEEKAKKLERDKEQRLLRENLRNDDEYQEYVRLKNKFSIMER